MANTEEGVAMGVTLSGDILKIAVFRALYLGDFICATPALRALRRHFPSAEITLIGLPWVQEALRHNRIVDRFEPFPGFPGLHEAPFDPQRTWQFLERMQNAHLDLALQLHGDGRLSNSFVSMLGAKLSLGFSTNCDLDRRLTFTLPWVEEENEVRRWSRLVRLLGAHSDEKVHFPFSPDDDRTAKSMLEEGPSRQGPLVGFHCGAKLPSRRWPIERFASLGNALADHTGATIVLTGSAHERALTAELREQVRGPVIDLAGRTTLGTLGAVVARLDLLVTNDTGISHVAAATRTPSVVLFGPSDPRRWAPLDKRRHRVVDAAARGQRSEYALSNLAVDPVLEMVLQMLQTEDRANRAWIEAASKQRVAVVEKPLCAG
ncbi:MAG: glycosyltransferase family 9 protein [Thermomicrobiales bacterium]